MELFFFDAKANYYYYTGELKYAVVDLISTTEFDETPSILVLLLVGSDLLSIKLSG